MTRDTPISVKAVGLYLQKLKINSLFGRIQVGMIIDSRFIVSPDVHQSPQQI